MKSLGYKQKGKQSDLTFLIGKSMDCGLCERYSIQSNKKKTNFICFF